MARISQLELLLLPISQLLIALFNGSGILKDLIHNGGSPNPFLQSLPVLRFLISMTKGEPEWVGVSWLELVVKSVILVTEAKGSSLSLINSLADATEEDHEKIKVRMENNGREEKALGGGEEKS
ncbi:hypothetical protein F5888DRAFT_1632292 [Russula emetica]|nr:hypothetical protein F5888DRAFT_1632292 [Russula emetica]